MSVIAPSSSFFARCKTTHPYKSNILSSTFLTLSMFLLSACGGGGGSDAPAGAETYILSASISGLNGTLVLENKYGDDATITENGNFKFPVKLAAGTQYSIRVKNSPAGQRCAVTSGAGGTISSAPIPKVVIVCTTIDSTAPVISLLGNSTVEVTVGNNYTDAGATALDDVDGDITNSIVKGGDAVNTATVGSYTITYNVSDTEGNAATPVTRTVTVVSATASDTTAPVITLNGTTPVTLEVNDSYTDAGASALDDVDGDITSSIVKGGDTVITATVGSYTITYNVSDIAGNNATQVTRTVNVVDTTKPVISLLGISPVTVEALSSYSDAGANAADNYDGDISSSITTVGDTINTGVVGTYTVTYDVSDAAGTAATQVTRTVIVEDTTAPVISLSDVPTVNLNLGDSYTDAGATATDTLDGNISVTVGGDPVNTSIVGSYTITYNVSDAAGNAATPVTRTVIVNLGTPTVTAYYTTAPNWNDYVKNDNTTQFNATNTPADGAETGGYSVLIHGGEMRSVNIGVTSCSDQAATDALGAFDWVCNDSTGSALMVSTGLKDSKNLSDLLDFTTPGWKNNSVTVTGTGAGFTTAATAWWSNPVTQNNTGGSLATAGSVYVIASNPALFYTIDASKIALVIQPGVTLTGPVTVGKVITANTQNYLWIEGAIDSARMTGGIYWPSVTFSVLRNLNMTETATAGSAGIYLDAASSNQLFNIVAANADRGIYFSNASDYNTLRNITASNNGNGVELSSSSNNTLSNITAKQNGSRGVQLLNSNDNTLSDINVTNNNSAGIDISGGLNNVVTNLNAVKNAVWGVLIGGSFNRLSNITASGSGNGVYISGVGTRNNTLSNIVVANNSITGVTLAGATSNNILSNMTISNNLSIGISMQMSPNNSLSNISLANNRDRGIYINSVGAFATTSSTGNTLANISSANGGTGIWLNAAPNNTFTGLLKVGSNTAYDCNYDAVTSFSDVSCTAVAPSDFTLSSSVSHATSFVGKVTTGDAANADDTNGTANYPADVSVFDWVNFDNSFRAWGNDGANFPAADNQSSWLTGTGRIWDWSLANGDNGDNGNPVLQNVLSVRLDGNAVNTIEHAWLGVAADQAACTTLVPGSVFNTITGDCRTTYLRNATEIAGDTIGNDNGLCESGETCLFTPNIGAYQGHGDLITAGIFTDGDTLSGITLMKYQTNGYQ